MAAEQTRNLLAQGARGHYRLHLFKTGYNCLEFGIQDLDDHEIGIGQGLD